MDIHQQLQENSLTMIKLPRDISNNDLPSGASSRGASPRMPRRKQTGQEADAGSQSSKEEGQGDPLKTNQVAPQTSKTAMMKTWLTSMPNKLNKNSNVDLQVPKLNIKAMSLVSKIKSGGAGAGRLLSKVAGANIFNKNEPNSDEADVFVEGISDKVTWKPRLDRKRTISKDDSSIDDVTELREEDLERGEVVLGSCGILAANAKQIIQTPQCSFDDTVIAIPPEHIAKLDVKEKTERDERSDTGVDKAVDRVNSSGLDMPGGIDNKAFNEQLDAKLSETARGRSTSLLVSSTHSDDVWVKGAHCDQASIIKPKKPQDLQPMSLHLVDNSEADQILAKYSPKKKLLSHPNMMNSMSDSALSAHVTVNLEDCKTDDSPKSVLDLSFEINADLQKKLPNLLQNAKMPRKTHRIYENLKEQIEKKLCDKVCHSTIMFV